MKKEHSQCNNLIAFMRTNNGITSMEAFKELGITRLSARIYELRDKGYTIESCWEESINRYGDKSRYCRYYLRESEDV